VSDFLIGRLGLPTAGENEFSKTNQRFFVSKVPFESHFSQQNFDQFSFEKGHFRHFSIFRIFFTKKHRSRHGRRRSHGTTSSARRGSASSTAIRRALTG